MHLLWKLPRTYELWGVTRPAVIVVPERCYDCPVFNFGTPKTPGQWIGHILAAIVALFLLLWLVRVYVV